MCSEVKKLKKQISEINSRIIMQNHNIKIESIANKNNKSNLYAIVLVPSVIGFVLGRYVSFPLIEKISKTPMFSLVKKNLPNIFNKIVTNFTL